MSAGFRSVTGRAYQSALKALSAMHSLGKRISPVQFRVRAPQSSQRSSGFHKPAVSGAAPETATRLRLAATAQQATFASTQQPADFFCRETLPGQHRLEDPFWWHCAAARVVQQQRHDVESVVSAGAFAVREANSSIWGN